MKILATAVAALALAACASAPLRWVPASDFQLVVVDNIALHRFDLELKSASDSAMCLSSASWPSVDGLPPGFDGATLTTVDGSKELQPVGSAYCPGGCGEIRLEPGERLQGRVPYSAFGDVNQIAAEDRRQLSFNIQPYTCSR